MRGQSIFAIGLWGAAAYAAPALAADPGTGRFVPGSDLDGVWEGVLANGGMGFPVVFTLTTTANDGTSAVLDILDRDAKDIPVASVRRDKMTVFLDVPAVGGRFDGLVSADLAAISGRWIQEGASGGPVPLILRRKAP